MASRYRHEDREAVPKGWKVRTVTAGKHRVRVAFPPGRRVKGSGRLVSILHPVGENPCELRSTNPAELMVMGANPPRGKRNPSHVYNEALKKWRIAQKEFDAVRKDYRARAVGDAEYLAARKQFNEAQNEMDRAEAAEMQRMGKNPAELIIAGANPRVEVVHGENPPAETIVEEFSGQEAKYLDVYNEPHMPRGRYAQIGPLIALYIKPAKGGQVQRIGAPEGAGYDFAKYWGGKPPIVVTDTTAKQIYFVDGAQDITECLEAFGGTDRGNGIVELGQARQISYQGRKEHVASPDEDLWKHEHGEENGVLPTVLFDTRSKRLLYEGGDYRIEGAWIRN